MSTLIQRTIAIAMFVCCINFSGASSAQRMNPGDVELVNGTGMQMSLAVRSIIPARGFSPWSRYLAFPAGKSMWFIRARCEVSLLFAKADYTQVNYRLGIVDFDKISRLDPNAKLVVRKYFVPGSELPQFFLEVHSLGKTLSLGQFLMQRQNPMGSPTPKLWHNALQKLGRS